MATISLPAVALPVSSTTRIATAPVSAIVLRSALNLNTLYAGAVVLPPTSTGGGTTPPSYYWS